MKFVKHRHCLQPNAAQQFSILSTIIISIVQVQKPKMFSKKKHHMAKVSPQYKHGTTKKNSNNYITFNEYKAHVKCGGFMVSCGPRDLPMLVHHISNVLIIECGDVPVHNERQFEWFTVSIFPGIMRTSSRCGFKGQYWRIH